MTEMLSDLALERGSTHSPDPAEEDVWAAQKLAGFREMKSRTESGVSFILLWRELGNLVLLGAHRETKDRVAHVLTLVNGEEAMDSLEHPVRYFSHDAGDQIFGQAA